MDEERCREWKDIEEIIDGKMMDEMVKGCTRKVGNRLHKGMN